MLQWIMAFIFGLVWFFLGGCTMGGTYNAKITHDEAAKTVTLNADADVTLAADYSALDGLLPTRVVAPEAPGNPD
jgi:hypothetical protein